MFTYGVNSNSICNHLLTGSQITSCGAIRHSSSTAGDSMYRCSINSQSSLLSQRSACGVVLTALVEVLVLGRCERRKEEG